ncbi:MAG TPA: AAA family ATPase [Ideonella sp.]|uniref:AAA family ATPase n=1 Tax=Ideonella sp. TaxID=1929293 RepID=UPI002C86A011|nr:AAA family ATPase [Ideonella sp.]HSI50594.1 AAA family ATPase [Ideonella sp.]
MNADTLHALCPAPGQNYDWAACCEAIPRLHALETTPQSPRYHAEGNVGIHTRMVLDALLADPHYQAAGDTRRQVLFLAALLHDLCKPETTVVDPLTGGIGQPGHSRRGAVDVRVLLWQAGVSFAAREAICRIVAARQVPFFAFDSRRGESPEFIARKLSWGLDLCDLVCVARADMRGRICEDQQARLDDIALFEELAREDGCWDGPKATASAHTRLMYARGAALHLDTPLFQPPGSQVIVLSGLPASGKNTWVDRHAAGLPVVSFDDAKTELGLKHGENDGMAAHHAVDKAKALLRRQSPFVWNATHLSEQMRNKTLDLLYAYDAQVQLVYLEVPHATLFQRNRQRDTTLSQQALARMLHRWELPLPWEAHEVRYVIGG